MTRSAVFLDRDGTVVVERDWVLRPEQLELERGAISGLQRLQRLSLPLVVISNQSAVARGLLRVEELEAVHTHLRTMLARHGVHLLDVLYCPHHPQEGVGVWRTECACRKPKSGLLYTAAQLHGLDLSRSWLIGDALRDMQAAAQADCRALLVRTGKGSADEARVRSLLPQTAIVTDLDAAARHIELTATSA
jgi:D-glycero-D-manno-heptose 1,7-bisphosphate phosphatase